MKKRGIEIRLSMAKKLIAENSQKELIKSASSKEEKLAASRKKRENNELRDKYPIKIYIEFKKPEWS